MRPESTARVPETVAAALERHGHERADFLDEECAGDAELRTEVESLLEHETFVADFIEVPPGAVAAQALGVAEAEDFGRRKFGAYETIREVGRGGLGTVYLAARADDVYQKEVAIKLLRRGLDTDDILRRFRNERQILARLEHPHIARLIDGGTSDDGLPYFVMEYVAGEPLTTYGTSPGLTTKERLELFRVVCGAVAYAHQHLVIHRDLKPSNILVTADGGVKLLDFGVAKLLDAEEDAAFVTLPQERVLTPNYASPEQIRGEQMTTASDVYSLGVVLCELLTGARSPDLTSKGLSGDLSNIVAMAMRPEPERRYLSVEQFSEDIRRHLTDLPVSARQSTRRYRVGKFIQRHKPGVAAAVLIALSLVAGLVATIWQARAAQRASVRAEAISSFLQRMLHASSPVAKAGGRDVTVKAVLDEASQRLGRQDLSAHPGVKAELQQIIGGSYLDLGEYAAAERNLSAALDAQTRMHGEDSPEALAPAVELAELRAGVQGNYAQAEEFYRRKLPLLRAGQKQGKISAEVLWSALNGFALSRRAQGDAKEAELLLREQLALRPQLSEPASDAGVVDATLALALADQGKFSEAIQFLRGKIAQLQQESRQETPSLAGTLTGLGSFLNEEGKLPEAEEHLRHAEAIYRKLYSASNLQLGDNLRLLAQVHAAQGRYAEAETEINETLQIYRAGTGPQYVNFATALMVQGQICAGTGRLPEAEKLLREALLIRTEKFPTSHFLRASANGALGEFLTGQRRFAEAEPFLLESYGSLQKSQAAQSPRLRRARQRLLALYEAWGKPEAVGRYRPRS